MRRRVVVPVALLVAILAVGLVSLGVGESGSSPAEVVRALTGSGEGSFTLMRLRLPRLLLAVLVGAGLGAAGSLLQTLLSNPLASPDLVGISQGASAAAVTAALVAGASGAVVSAAAFAGALAVALVIGALAWRQGFTGQRFVLIGVGFAFAVNALINFLVTRADVREAQGALAWLVGSLGTPHWEEVAVTAVGLAVVGALCVPLVRPLRMLQLGDDTARALGVRVTAVRVGVTLVAVAFAAVAIAAAGPVAFVAFVAEPIARRLVGGSEAAVVASAAVGALVVVAADLVAQHLLPLREVPVGVVTSLVGAPYLLLLLARENRRRDA